MIVLLRPTLRLLLAVLWESLSNSARRRFGRAARYIPLALLLLALGAGIIISSCHYPELPADRTPPLRAVELL